MGAIHTSVIIPSLHSPWLGQIIDALRGQDYDLAGTEVLVVGLDKYGIVQEDDLVTFLSTGSPVLPGVARNLGICHASGGIVCFLDADCLPDRDWLAHLTAPFDDDAVCVVGGVIRFAGDTWTTADTMAHFANVIAGTSRRELTDLPALNLGVRRCLFWEIGLFDDRFRKMAGEDAELTKRMRHHGYDLHLVRDAVVTHMARRRGLLELLRRAWVFGSAAGVCPLAQLIRTESALFQPGVLLLTSVPRALATTARVFMQTPNARRHWRAAPIVFVIKLVWALSAALALLRSGKMCAK